MPLSIALLSLSALAAPALEWAGGYHGDTLTHPGVELRVARPLLVGEEQALQLEAELGGWWHPERWVALYGRAGVAASREGARLDRYGLFLHAGLGHGFWAAPAYRVEGEAVARAVLAGDSWALCAAGVELGADLQDRGGWYLRPQATARFPTFHGVGWDLALGVGVRR